MVNFGPLAAEIISLVWGTPGNFNGFRVLAALLHGTLVEYELVSVSELMCLCQTGPERACSTACVGIGRLREELKAAARAKRSLERELVSARRDSDAMLDTLRRKERQFTDDHRQLEMKNRQLSDVLDAFTDHAALIAPQRRHNCVTAARRQRDVITSSCRGRDDVSTQTDDVSVAALNSHDYTDMHVRHTHTHTHVHVFNCCTYSTATVVIYEPL